MAEQLDLLNILVITAFYREIISLESIRELLLIQNQTEIINDPDYKVLRNIPNVNFTTCYFTSRQDNISIFLAQCFDYWGKMKTSKLPIK